MTAGSGVIHQEMPKGDSKGRMKGFQLWANLPAANKMMAPRYQDITASQIPTVHLDNGVSIKIICGQVNGTSGPVRDIVIDPEYLDITIPPGTTYLHPTKAGHTVLAYVIEGDGYFDIQNQANADNNTLILFEDGEHVYINTDKDPIRFLLISGQPIGEPIAWHGPIVMNTQEELQTAFEEYEKGTFIK